VQPIYKHQLKHETKFVHTRECSFVSPDCKIYSHVGSGRQNESSLSCYFQNISACDQIS